MKHVRDGELKLAQMGVPVIKTMVESADIVTEICRGYIVHAMRFLLDRVWMQQKRGCYWQLLESLGNYPSGPSYSKDQMRNH